jgi:3-hydroxyacyl-CoA dehydrogenase/enoyl-CoA hydratase/3-hydroxybutyryl-CoA epimerase
MTYDQVEQRNGVAVVWLDQPGEKVNKISRDLLDGFSGILHRLESDPTVKGVVLISRKEDNFIAGADLDQFRRAQDPAPVEALSRDGHGILNRMAAFPKPIVAAIHGAAFGGGLEVALACQYRIATDDPRTVMALPEVKLGLLPAGGGTQRLPRLVGLQGALDMMLTGKNIYPRQAKKMGLVDEVVDRYTLLAAAVTAALELAGAPLERRTRRTLLARILESTPFSRRLVYKKAREKVRQMTWGNYPAPFGIIDCVEAGLEKGFAEGERMEEKTFGELAMTSQSRELIQIFFSMTALKKNPFKDQVRPVRKIGILGAGLMGSGIASVSVANGMDVLLKDVSPEALGRAEKILWKELDEKAGRRIITPFQRDRAFSRVSGAESYRGFEKADLVIEAVFEDPDLKRKILREAEAVIREDAIFASNTSSLPITGIAEASVRPGRVIGMHYFSPVPRMPLLEIIVTEKTEPWVTATAVDTGIRQGKTVIVVNDGPGFYTTRILAPFLNEALLLLHEGADIEDIDSAMRRFGYPVGPLTLLDEVGIDVGAHVSRVLGPLFAARGIRPDESLEVLFKAGYRGRKNNRGFYLYEPSGRKGKKEVNEEVYDFFGGSRRVPIADEEIQKRLSLVMTNEAACCLQEGILNSPREGDIGAVFGLGFPPFLGGPFRYMDRLGAGRVLSMLEDLANIRGNRFHPAGVLREMAAENKRFYDR